MPPKGGPPTSWRRRPRREPGPGPPRRSSSPACVCVAPSLPVTGVGGVLDGRWDEARKDRGRGVGQPHSPGRHLGMYAPRPAAATVAAMAGHAGCMRRSPSPTYTQHPYTQVVGSPGARLSAPSFHVNRLTSLNDCRADADVRVSERAYASYLWGLGWMGPLGGCMDDFWRSRVGIARAFGCGAG